MEEGLGEAWARARQTPEYQRLEEYALALVSALELAARTGGRPTFDSLFDRGFDRIYALSYRIAERNTECAQEITSQVLLGAAGVIAAHAVEADRPDTADPVHDPPMRNHKDDKA
jgi:hypothetical protein